MMRRGSRCCSQGSGHRFGGLVRGQYLSFRAADMGFVVRGPYLSRQL